MRGHKDVPDWAKSLCPKARERFRYRRINGSYTVPGEYVIRDCLIRVESFYLDRALQRWNLPMAGTTKASPSREKIVIES